MPIKQVLRKPDLASRRGHIKGQALADFIIELAPIDEGNNSGNEWFLCVDGASNQRGSGASVILEGSNGVTSNNQVRYEALLTRMKLAEELAARILTTESDSKLIIGQMNGDYQAGTLNW
ncbi:hypothetical protein CR513_56100, partial [Mucuna pruriens]